MLMRIRRHTHKRNAQSTVEYGILIGVIIAAAVAMQTYVKRSIQAKQKDASDMVTNVAGNFSIVGPVGATVNSLSMATTNQYEPYYLSRHQQSDLSKDNLHKNVASGGAATTTRQQTSKGRSAVIYRYDQNEE